MSHTCHANLCGASCRPEHLMCQRHWAMVPQPSKDAVLRHYRPGQCSDMRPSREWIDAAKLAVAQVAVAEGKPMSRHQRTLIAAAPKLAGEGIVSQRCYTCGRESPLGGPLLHFDQCEVAHWNGDQRPMTDAEKDWLRKELAIAKAWRNLYIAERMRSIEFEGMSYEMRRAHAEASANDFEDEFRERMAKPAAKTAMGGLTATLAGD